MPKKKTAEEFIQDAIKVHGDRYDYVKVKYVNSRTNIIIICKEHGEFEQSPHSHLKGYNCYKCGRINASSKVKNTNNSKKYTNNRVYKEIIEKYKDIDFQNINKRLKNTDKLNCICKKCNFEWKKQISNIYIRGLKCPNCNKNKRFIWNNKSVRQLIISNKDFNNKIDFSLNIELKIKDYNSELKCICKICNYGFNKEWATTITNIYTKKRGCPSCAGNQKLSLEDCHKTALEKGGKCLSNIYNNKEDKIEWECEKNHKWFARYGSVRRGTWCPKCNCCPSCELFNTNKRLCSYCKPKSKNKLYKKAYEKSKELVVVKFLREKLPDYDFIHNKSVGSHCTKDEKENSNGHLFPDIRFDCDFYHLIVEVDEHKHSGADYKCDEKRMYDIIAKLGLPCIFIRYNPDSKESNKKILLEKIQKYLELDIEDDNIWDNFGFKAEYLFY